MAQFCVLASSSAGNSAYISSGGQSVLIDAGISCKRIFNALAGIGADAHDVAAVLLTHEHIDHIGGLRVFVQRTGAAVCATAPVLGYLVANGCVPVGATLCEVQAGQMFEVAGMRVQAFCTPHDSVGSVGYRLLLPGGQTVAVATDLGGVTDEVERGVTGCELVMLESNYDPQLLRMGAYPYYLKQRIASERGHLSNENSACFAQRLLVTGTTRLFLAHLSRENNNPALAEQTVNEALCLAGAVRGVDYELEVAPYDAPGRLVQF